MLDGALLDTLSVHVIIINTIQSSSQHTVGSFCVRLGVVCVYMCDVYVYECVKEYMYV